MGYIASGLKAFHARTIQTVIDKLKGCEQYAEISLHRLIAHNLFLYPYSKLRQMLGLLALKRKIQRHEEKHGEETFNVYRNQEETLFWPQACAPDLPLWTWGELLPRSPHNYFDLHSPRTGEVVFDIGACEGSFGLRCLKKYGAGRVYFFDPIVSTCRALALTLRDYVAENRAEICQIAIADYEGGAFFACDPLNVNGARMTDKSPAESGIQVPVSTIDAFVEKNGLDKLNLIKMDIEGAELSALKGAVRTLRTLKPDVMVCTYHNPSDFAEVRNLLTPCDYVLVKHSWGFPPTVCHYAPKERAFKRDGEVKSNA